MHRNSDTVQTRASTREDPQNVCVRNEYMNQLPPVLVYDRHMQLHRDLEAHIIPEGVICARVKDLTNTRDNTIEKTVVIILVFRMSTHATLQNGLPTYISRIRFLSVSKLSFTRKELILENDF